MINKGIEYYSDKGHTLEDAQKRFGTHHKNDNRGRLPGQSEDFIRPIWTLPKPK